MLWKNPLFILLLALCLALVSCTSSVPAGKTEAETLFKEAQAHMDHNRNELAIEKLNTIKSQYPYSYYATYAELLLADIMFKQESYIEAAAAYLTFKELHPKNEKMDYVLWQIAESYYNQLPSTVDRDLSTSKEAMHYYQELLERFPQTSHKEEANTKLEKVRQMLREHDLYVAHFYFKTDVYFSARHRYLDIIEKYKDFPTIVDLSAERIVESSRALKEYDSCLRYIGEFESKVSAESKKRLLLQKEQCLKGGK